MKKKIELKPYIIAAIISLIIGGGIFCLIFLVFRKSVLDGIAFPGIILLSVALFIWISREGFFDLLSYGFKQLGSALFSKAPTQYNDYAGYRQQAYEIREKRSKYYLGVGLVGLLFLIAAIIYYICTK